jgi:TRAF3-interacting protein 1
LQASEAARKKERDTLQKDLEGQRANIQTLTKSVNPLNKLLDFVQEDLDAMQKEAEMWRREHAENMTTLLREDQYVLCNLCICESLVKVMATKG